MTPHLAEAVDLARHGYRVMWVCKLDQMRALLDEIDDPDATIRRPYGRGHASWPSGGCIHLLSTYAHAGRGHFGDAVFVPGSMRKAKAMENLIPILNGSQLGQLTFID